MLHSSFAEKGTFVEQVRFIQYLDENTALEEVRNGNLDIYFFRVSSDRIESNEAREGIQIFESTGGSYSMLVNPSVSDNFNPFSITELRFALNYLIDRNLIVNEFHY
jgi:peptide/nickel transport system substrate-binding protein